MNNIVMSLEELEYLLIKSKCLYLFGFRDVFLKYEKAELFRRFEKLSDDLEGKDFITCDIEGIEIKEDKKELFENILKVEKYYDISVAKYGELIKKYRIFEYNKRFTIIEMQTNDNSIIDEKNIYLYSGDSSFVIDSIRKCLEKGYTIKSDTNDNVEITNEYLESIKGISSKEFETLNKEKNIATSTVINNLYNTINNTKELLSISITDMKKRKSKVYLYLTNRDNLVAMSFKLKGAEHNWILTEMSDDTLKTDLTEIVTNGKE